ncbi:MAG: S8 family serine peptidase, partial [Planctomycetales bacterium]|nr:S8 family serine peptidase [Planctomycetales bacterium]
MKTSLGIEDLEKRLAMTGTSWSSDSTWEWGEPEIQAGSLAATGGDVLSIYEAIAYANRELGLTGAGQTVAVIDSGIAYDHYALGGGWGTSYRVVGGWDFAENDADPYDDGPLGYHGTHIAGVIGSTDTQHPGVAPDVDLVALRVFDDYGHGEFAAIESALDWVHDHQFD